MLAGLLGTVSVWSSADALRALARDRPRHPAVVARTGPERWYAEELYARFAVLEQDGTLA